MKNTYSIAQRNEIVEENLWRIDAIMKRNRALILAARMDEDDVDQQLAVRLIRAVSGFDPDKGILEQHLMAQLQYEMLSCKDARRLLGITQAPKELRGGNIISFESIREDSELYGQLMAA